MTDIDAAIINAEDINADDIDAIILGDGAATLKHRAYIALDNLDAFPTFSEGIWNQIDNTGASHSLEDESMVLLGWTLTNSTFSNSPLSLGTTPFYDANVYALRRLILNPAVSETFTFTGLNDVATYTFLASGSYSSATGPGTREITMSVDSSGDTAVILCGPDDPVNDHLGTISGQSPTAGSIVVTVTATNSSQGVLSTLEIQEYL